jgi:hypothetical protein
MENLPSVVNMSSETKYRGDPLTVSTKISPAIGFSGNPAVRGYTTPCSFYNSTFTTKKLEMSIDSNDFVANYGSIQDDSLSFGLDLRPLNVEVTNVQQSCQEVTGMPLTVQTGFGWGRGRSDVSALIELIAYENVPDMGLKNFFASGASANCAPELEISVEISSAEDGPPEGAGLTYLFTGPSITFNMATVEETFETAEVQALTAFRNLAFSPNATYTVRTLSTSKEFFFSTDGSARIYDGALDGQEVEYRAVPDSPEWTLRYNNGSPRTRYGLTTSIYYPRDNRYFTASVAMNYRIDYRFAGEDWVIGAASDRRVSNTLRVRVN